MLVERTFEGGAVPIHYAEEPGSGPPLLLLHGVTSRWQNFLNVLPVFTTRWHVVAADLRGHGRSGHAEGHYGLMEYAADIIALLRHLSDQPAVLIGHSLGAMISIGVAAEAPELVRAVVLEDPPLTAFDGRPFTARAEHDRFVTMRDLARQGHAAAELAKLLASTIPEGNDVAVRTRAASLSQIDPEVLTAIIENRSIAQYDLGERLRRIVCPTLLLQGNPALGGALTDEEADWAKSLISDCAHVSLPHVGHGIHAADGPAFSQTVVSFLEAL
ncbi:MAG: alpha/beta fold hydrolase [Chloroflexota bacterium]